LKSDLQRFKRKIIILQSSPFAFERLLKNQTEKNMGVCWNYKISVDSLRLNFFHNWILPTQSDTKSVFISTMALRRLHAIWYLILIFFFCNYMCIHFSPHWDLSLFTKVAASSVYRSNYLNSWCRHCSKIFSNSNTF